jgi:hypothetical protein
MVRIFKVENLEERRRLLLEQSELNRELLRGDVAGLKSTADKFRSSWKKWAAVAAIGGFLVTRRGGNNGSKPGLVSRLIAGVRMAGEVVGIVGSFRKHQAEATKRDGEHSSRA